MKHYKDYVLNHDCYKTAEVIDIKGIIIYLSDSSEASAQTLASGMNKPGKGFAPQGVVDGSGRLVQTMNWERHGFHSGGSADSTHIGIVLTNPENKLKSTADYMVKNQYKTLSEVCANLCERFKLNPLEKGVIITAGEGCECGICEMKKSPEALWNAFAAGFTPDTLREDVSALMRLRRGVTDGTISSGDIAGLVDIICGRKKATLPYLLTFDTNGDGVIEISNLVSLIKSLKNT